MQFGIICSGCPLGVAFLMALMALEALDYLSFSSVFTELGHGNQT